MDLLLASMVSVDVVLFFMKASLRRQPRVGSIAIFFLLFCVFWSYFFSTNAWPINFLSVAFQEKICRFIYIRDKRKLVSEMTSRRVLPEFATGTICCATRSARNIPDLQAFWRFGCFVGSSAQQLPRGWRLMEPERWKRNLAAVQRSKCVALPVLLTSFIASDDRTQETYK